MMEYPLPEILDRRSIILLKIERIPAEAESFKKELAEYDRALMDYNIPVEKLNDWAARLYEVNGMIWDLESKIRAGQLRNISLDQVGATAIKIRETNGLRIQIKSEIVAETGHGFQDTKINHASVKAREVKEPKRNTVLITAYKEPHLIGRCVDSFKQPGVDEIIVMCPDDETAQVARAHGATVAQDPGKGKSYALNQFLKDRKETIGNLIMTDGDVYVSDNAVHEMVQILDEIELVGCVTGRVVPTNDPTTKWGYMAHALALGAHKERFRRYRASLHLEASGYLWAIRKGSITEFPLDVAEDSIVPLLLREKGLSTAYAHRAIVYVKYPETLEDFVKQKIRTAESHANLDKYIKNPPKMKSFLKESVRGLPILAAKTAREIGWTVQLIFLRLKIWMKAKKGKYQDGWETVASTK